MPRPKPVMTAQQYEKALRALCPDVSDKIIWGAVAWGILIGVLSYEVELKHEIPNLQKG